MSPLEDALATLARQGRTVTYGALARDLGLRLGEVTAELERLMEQDLQAGHPLRAALCEGKLSQGLPAQGFFQKCAGLGLDVDDPVAFVADHRTRLFSGAT
jgi:hypothetical protein